jgi:hypothetical protein
MKFEALLTLKMFLVAWLLWSFLAMALLGLGHTASNWCRKYSVATNPVCRFIDLALEIEGQ